MKRFPVHSQVANLKSRIERDDAGWMLGARSRKHWLVDPQSIAWERFHTLADIPVFSRKAGVEATAAVCCGVPT